MDIKISCEINTNSNLSNYLLFLLRPLWGAYYYTIIMTLLSYPALFFAAITMRHGDSQENDGSIFIFLCYKSPHPNNQQNSIVNPKGLSPKFRFIKHFIGSLWCHRKFHWFFSTICYNLGFPMVWFDRFQKLYGVLW